MYVNDAIDLRMRPEQKLYYSENAFGTADAICFRKKILRIHDLKTGGNPASMKQLEIEAALFCLEYSVDPIDISIRLRVYQSNDVTKEDPDPDLISDIMDKIVSFDNILNQIKMEE